MRRRLPAVVLLATVAAAAAVALGGAEGGYVALEEAKPGDRIEAQGTIQTVGSEPHIYLALVVEHDKPGDVTVFRLVGDLERARAAEGRVMLVRGVIESEAMGPGFPAELRVTEINPAPAR